MSEETIDRAQSNGNDAISEQLFFTDRDNPADVRSGRIILTTAHERRLDLIAYFTAMMEADHLAAIGKKGEEAEAKQEVAEDKSKRDWRGSQSRQDLNEDQLLLTEGATRHARNTLFVPPAIHTNVAVTQTKDSRDAIQGSGRRSIPKGSIGRGTMATRTQQDQHVDASAKSGNVTVKLGTQQTVPHRPQGFGGRSGAVTFT